MRSILKIVTLSLVYLTSLVTYADTSASAEGACSVDKLPLSDSFEFSTLLNYNSFRKASALKKDTLWWPLGGAHSTTETRLMFSSTTDTPGNVVQSFSYLKTGSRKNTTLGLLSLGTIEPYLLRARNIREKFDPLTNQVCSSPRVLTWETNNPLIPETKLRYIYVGEINRGDRTKIPHLEIVFPDNTRIRMVERRNHHFFGISADEALVKLTRDYPERHLDFRELSGLFEFKITSQCDELSQALNKIQNLGHCLAKDLKREDKTFDIASIHMGERNQRWVARLSFLPTKESGRLKELYTSVVDLSYSLRAFRWDSKPRMSYQLEFGRPGPEYVLIDKGRVPSVGGINGDGNWDRERQFLNLNIDYDQKIVEFEYFKILQENSGSDYQRTIIPVYGFGRHLSPTR